MLYVNKSSEIMTALPWNFKISEYSVWSGLASERIERRLSIAVDVYNSIIAIKPLYNYNYDHYQVDRLTMLSMLVTSTSHGARDPVIWRYLRSTGLKISEQAANYGIKIYIVTKLLLNSSAWKLGLKKLDHETGELSVMRPIPAHPLWLYQFIIELQEYIASSYWLAWRHEYWISPTHASPPSSTRYQPRFYICLQLSS